MTERESMDKKTGLKCCPECGGAIELYSVLRLNVPYVALAQCNECDREYPLPNVKLKTWKSDPTRISKKMIRQAEKEWNNGNYSNSIN